MRIGRIKLSSVGPRPATIAASGLRSLNATVGRLSSEGFHREVLLAFASMLKSPETTPDFFTYPSALKACIALRFLSLSLSIHQRIIVSGYASDSYISSSLISLYGNFKNVDYARKVFDQMAERNIVPWTAIIRCYSCAGDMKNAFFMYSSMQYEGISPSSITILNVLSKVTEGSHVEMLHVCVLKNGYICDAVLTNCLLSVYATKCGRLKDARKIFELLEAKDVVSWNSLINAYSIVGDVHEVLKLFRKMTTENIEPDQQTFGSLVSAIASQGNLQAGRVVHGKVITYGFASHKHVETSLITFLSRCGKVDDALQIFNRAVDKDAVFFTAMISGLVRNDSTSRALRVFQQMLDSRLMPSTVTIACVLAACAQLGSRRLGISIHGYTLRRQLDVDIPVQNSLVTMYAKCGLLEKSFAVFSTIEGGDTVSWNAIVAGYAQNGYLEKALNFFHAMRLSQRRPDSVTVVSLLQVCASVGAYHQGKWIHNYILRSCLGPCIKVDTALVDMYAKCGDLVSARECFNRMPRHDSVSWSTIISGYGSHGKGIAALEMFSGYLQSGLTPNDVVFLSALYACSHSGLFQNAMMLFESMKDEHGIEPSVEHRACIVDLLCRAGRVREAYEFYRKMFAEPAVLDVLRILLLACRNSGEDDIERLIVGEISKFESADAGTYVQLAHSFAATAKWGSVGDAWIQMRTLGRKKLPGWSFVEMQGVIVPFFTSHSSHPQYANIECALLNLTSEMMEEVEDPDLVCNS
ncbi:hypothetical protein M569_02796 [Genlisea aurea]|uniref:Pentatricopeptide repeat-containing protein n=1 Tax=Genlisea aurea TaxID=192259 RepID=S8CY88_9LAMI|nr:hypothetical protein M569_02796 [Genlisea aurea]